MMILNHSGYEIILFLVKDEETGKWTFLHHPFTSPALEDMDKFDFDPGSAGSRAYDLVINGWEIRWWLHQKS